MDQYIVTPFRLMKLSATQVSGREICIYPQKNIRLETIKLLKFAPIPNKSGPDENIFTHIGTQCIKQRYTKHHIASLTTNKSMRQSINSKYLHNLEVDLLKSLMQVF